MRSSDRVKAAINFEPTDRLPVIAQIFAHTAVIAGETIQEYVSSGRRLAECQIKALERYGCDAIFAVMDVNVETEALGSELVYRLNDYPYVQSHAFTRSTNLEAVSTPDPYTAGRMPEILKALGIMRREVGDEVLVVGCVLGPMTLATQLVGMETALYLAIDDPDGFEKLLDFATSVIIRFGTAQIEAGAHSPLVFDPSASMAVIPASFFREFELPRLTQIISAFQSAGASAGWLHIAGPLTPVLPVLEQTGANIFNFDYCVDPNEVLSLKPQLCFNGNIKSLDFEIAEPEDIFNESLRLKDLFSVKGGFVLSSGCEIPPGSKPENIEAMVAATRNGR
ncbi:MAG: uroporphyrinogen decarboxylase family protein [Syntrophobacteraceae bacterium]|jgi:uroporphyrinogen decarboxylase